MGRSSVVNARTFFIRIEFMHKRLKKNSPVEHFGVRRGRVKGPSYGTTRSEQRMEVLI